MQIGDALLKSKAREFAGFGDDSLLVPRQFCSPLPRWKVAEGKFHCHEPSVPEEWHNSPRNSAWKTPSTETKVTEVPGLSTTERESGKISGRSELWPAADVSLPGSSADV